VPVPKGTRAKDLNVSIKKKSLAVGLKGKEAILTGELCKEIKVDDSTWTVGGCPMVPLCPSNHRHRGPGNGPCPPREIESTTMVGERAHPSSKDRHHQDSAREQQVERP
jgi:hypothetical protein